MMVTNQKPPERTGQEPLAMGCSDCLERSARGMGGSWRSGAASEEHAQMLTSLRAVVACGRLHHKVSLGIAGQILMDGGLDYLSPRQRVVFDRFIEPQLNLPCDHCGFPIPPAYYPDALDHGLVSGLTLCERCECLR